jgi:hypothetical protein
MIGASPWTVPFRFIELGAGPVKRALEADVVTCRAVARHLDVETIGALTADLTVRPWLDGAEVRGRFRAVVTQLCSVSAELFDESVEGEFMVRVLAEGSPNAPAEPEGEEVDLDPEADDPPDVVDGGAFDLGGYVVEHLSLELDPFPRKPGATFQPPEPTEPASPFAVLKLLRKDDATE